MSVSRALSLRIFATPRRLALVVRRLALAGGDRTASFYLLSIAPPMERRKAEAANEARAETE